MAITISAPVAPELNVAYSVGPMKEQILKYTVASGATSGTVTASSLSQVRHVYFGDSSVKHSAAPTISGNVATLAFVVPTSTAATLTKGGVTYTAVASDNSGNLISVAYTAGGTAGSEVVTVTGNAISVQIESTVSTITQVRTAVNLSAPAALLVTASGTSASAVTAAAASFLTGGITGGGAGFVMCTGI